MLSLNLERLLTGDLNRLRYIKRFGTALTLHQENVAEHTFYVTMYSYLIALWVNEVHINFQVSIEEVLVKALVHDLEEVRTGDFPRPFKYKSEVLRSLIEESAEEEFKDMMSDVFPQISTSLTHKWKHSKNLSTPSGCIVSLADFLSVISHLWQEVNCSNASMYDHYDSVMKYVQSFKVNKYDFLRPLVNEVERITDLIFEEYQGKKNG